MEVGHEENGSGEDVIHLLIAEVLQLSLQFLIVCVREYARVFVEVADGVLLQRVLRFEGVVLADPDQDVDHQDELDHHLCAFGQGCQEDVEGSHL